MDLLRPPILTSLDPEPLQGFASFVTELRKGSRYVAKLEAQRLEPYLEELAAVLAEDAAKGNKRLEKIANVATLIDLFNAIADATRNVVLSGILFAPSSLLDHPLVHNGDAKNNSYIPPAQFKNHTYRFGFFLAHEAGDRSSVSVPVLAFDDKLMAAIKPFAPEAMLRHFQHVLETGNHDMKHHFSNTALSMMVSRKKSPAHNHMRDWYDAHFALSRGQDLDLTSYESWIMSSHRHVFKRLEQGPLGGDLRRSCDAFFDELGRIAREMAATQSKQAAHDMVEFFGTFFCFAMMRYKPVDDPLLTHAVERMQGADPMPETFMQDGDDIKRSVDFDVRGYARQAILNYATRGPNLLDGDDYVSLKKLDLIMTAPWIAHLLSPAPEGSDHQKVVSRVTEVRTGMFEAALDNTYFDLPDGKYEYTFKNGNHCKKQIKNHKLHCEDGPAFTAQRSDHLYSAWYNDGELQKYTYHYPKTGMTTETQLKNGEPCFMRVVSEYGIEEETHHDDGTRHIQHLNTNGILTREQWWKEHTLLREVNIDAKGVRSEKAPAAKAAPGTSP